MSKTILITGADGYLGGTLTKTMLNSTPLDIALWIRVKDKEEFDKKKNIIYKNYVHDSDRIKLYSGDLLSDNPFESIPTSDINQIIHSAAITRFNVESDLANNINHKGSYKMMEFARRCKSLEQFSYISTIYSSGLKAGTVREEYIDPNGDFCNFYEKSKCQAEHLLHNEFDDLPWKIFRPATLISDNDTGNVSQYNVFHNTMRLLFYGLISLIPGNRNTPVYMTTCQYAADAITQITQHHLSDQHKIYNVCHNKALAINLGDLIDQVFVNFQNDFGFKKRNILKPLFTSMEAFEALSDGLKGLGGTVVREALESIKPFSRQLYIIKDIRNDNLLKAAPNLPPIHLSSLVSNVTNNLVNSKWGAAR